MAKSIVSDQVTIRMCAHFTSNNFVIAKHIKLRPSQYCTMLSFSQHSCLWFFCKSFHNYEFIRDIFYTAPIWFLLDLGINHIMLTSSHAFESVLCRKIFLSTLSNIIKSLTLLYILRPTINTINTSHSDIFVNLVICPTFFVSGLKVLGKSVGG